MSIATSIATCSRKTEKIEDKSIGALKLALRLAEKKLIKKEKEHYSKIEEIKNEYESKLQDALEKQRRELIGRQRMDHALLSSPTTSTILSTTSTIFPTTSTILPTTSMTTTTTTDMELQQPYYSQFQSKTPSTSRSSLQEDFALSLWTEFIELVHDARTDRKRTGNLRHTTYFYILHNTI